MFKLNLACADIFFNGTQRFIEVGVGHQYGIAGSHGGVHIRNFFSDFSQIVHERSGFLLVVITVSQKKVSGIGILRKFFVY